MDENTKEFFEQHRIENNWFDNFKAAEEFFNKMGFVIDKEAEIQKTELSSMKYFLNNVTPEQLSKFSSAGKIQATWRLKAV